MRRPAGGISLASLAITPSLGAVAPGTVLQMTATGTYSDGSTRDLTSAVVWSTDNGAVATVTNGSAGGSLTAGPAGSCNVTATLGLISDTIPMTIPASSQFRSTWTIPRGLGGTPEAGGRVYAFSEFIPPDVTTLNVRLANRLADGSVQPSITVNVAVYQSDGTGKPTGAAFASFVGQVVPGDNTILSVGPFPGVVRGVTDGRVVVLVGMAQGETPTFEGHCVSGFYTTGTSTVDPAPGPFSSVNSGSIMVVHLEYNSAARHIVVIGDSITVGFDATDTLEWNQTAFQLIAANRVWSVDVEGVPGFGSLQHSADFATYPNLWDEALVAGADGVIDLGSNDLAYNDLTIMQTSLQTVITHFLALGAANLYAATIPPISAYPAANATRLAYNAWLLANFAGLGLVAVRDRAAKQVDGGLADNADTNILYAPYDTGDGTHINAAGNVQEQIGWEAIL